MKLTLIVIRNFFGVHRDDLVHPSEPHMGHCHAVLRQCARLVGADDGRRAQRLHRFQILHQTLLFGHSLGRQRQTDLEQETRININFKWEFSK